MHGLQEGHRDLNRPGNLHQKEKHYTEMCGAFFVSAKRVRAQFTRKSAVHGLQEGHRDLNWPGNLHQKEKHYTEMCGAYLLSACHAKQLMIR